MDKTVSMTASDYTPTPYKIKDLGDGTFAPVVAAQIVGSNLTLEVNEADLANVGAKADPVATDDTGSWSLIALLKRGLQRWTTLLAKIPNLTAANRMPVETASAVATATGNITTQNLVAAGVATLNSAVEVVLNGAGSLTVQVTGVYTGALSAQLTVDGTNWVTMGGLGLINVGSGASTPNIPSATAGIFQLDVAGAVKARITGLAAMTGTAAVTLSAVQQPSAVAIDSAVVLQNSSGTQITSTTSNADALATTGSNQCLSVTGMGRIFNGNTWDRERKPSGVSRLLSAAATTNATLVKAAAGDLWRIRGKNATAAPKYLKLYNKATAPVVGTDVPALTVELPPNTVNGGYFDIPFDGTYFSAGIGYGLTGAIADLDTTALVAGDIVSLSVVYAQ